MDRVHPPRKYHNDLISQSADNNYVYTDYWDNQRYPRYPGLKLVQVEERLLSSYFIFRINSTCKAEKKKYFEDFLKKIEVFEVYLTLLNITVIKGISPHLSE